MGIAFKLQNFVQVTLHHQHDQFYNTRTYVHKLAILHDNPITMSTQG